MKALAPGSGVRAGAPCYSREPAIRPRAEGRVLDGPLDESMVADVVARHRHKNFNPGIRRRAGLGLVALAGACVAAAPALAQQERLVASHGAWNVKCETPPGAANEQCWAEQKVTAEDRPRIGLTVVFRQAPDSERRVLWMQAPLGVYLPRQLGLRIDGEEVGSVPYLRCPRAGCIAEAQMDDTLLERFTGGSEALFIIFESPESGIGIPVDLNGFEPAIDELARVGPGE